MTRGNFRGGRLFAGRLFAGRLFGPASDAGMPPMMGRRRVGISPRLRAIDDDDTMLLIASALCAGYGALV